MGEGWRWRELRADWERVRYSWVGWKNMVVGPVTEELVFRAGMVPLQMLAGRSFGGIVLTTPLFFGIGIFRNAITAYAKEAVC